MSHTPASEQEPKASYKKTIGALCAFFVLYAVLLLAGLPQKWTQAQFHHDDHATAEALEQVDNELETVTDVIADASDVAADGENVTELVDESLDNVEEATQDVSKIEEELQADQDDAEAQAKIPPLWTSIPFVLLLLCIAVLPLIPATEHWWESNLHRFLVAAVLGLVTLGYYAFLCDFPIDLHWPGHKVVDPSAGSFAMASTVFINAILGEYVSFIVLLFALFSITGGIRISGDLKASPLVNTVILGIGATMASFVGTTGAAMLLIRLLLDTNKERKHKIHTVVFFIFCVCNVGGCLLPIGDPPLFLGYLRGVGFLWTFHLWKQWLFVCSVLLTLYFLIDAFIYYPRETSLNKALDNVVREPLRIRGLMPNLFCLIGVIFGVMLLDPAQEFLALFNVKTGWYPPMFARECVQLLMVAISFIFGSNQIRKENDFNFSAILEVAALFFGIFICMQAPLQILNAKGAALASTVHNYGAKIKLNQPKEFFWISGTLSSVLDNAPTYVVFFETARAATEGELKQAQAIGDQERAEQLAASLQEGEQSAGVRVPIALLIAVSLGSVFMGAMTYIGNGPNFMVKSIAEQSGVKMPSFFGYMAYSVGILLPVLIIMTIIFL
ncbi:MAG: sodium:proton antiporter [Planctomycetia bacterium]|nr:sodium:proton antiporter [Planctomycetia bacterium]